MKLYIYYLEILIPSLLATVYGLAAILRRHKGLYFSMGVLAIVCLMVGQLAYCASTLVGHAETGEFHIGALGSMGSCLFFLTANMGPMNSLADDNSPELKRYRVRALLGPAAAVLLYGVCVLLMVRLNYYVGLASGIALTALNALSLYYSTKMNIIPDVKGGFVDCLRPYNGIITLLGLLNTLERGLRNLWQDTPVQTVLSLVLYGLIGLSTMAAMIYLKKGAEAWVTI